MARLSRVVKELKMMEESPPSGISCWSEGDNLMKLKATIFADDESVYRGGVFKLDIEIPARYPFQPPNIRFGTRIYHPNIDSSGRICLDALKMPPAGGWRPALNIASILASIRLLMNAPNADDPLMLEIAQEFKLNREEFERKAREWTQRYAIHEVQDKTNSAESDS